MLILRCILLTDIVFFGEKLPDRFFECVNQVREIYVQPFDNPVVCIIVVKYFLDTDPFVVNIGFR